MSRALIRRAERDITERTITALLNAGHAIAVNDGETIPAPSLDGPAALANLMDLDDAYLQVYAKDPCGNWYGGFGWVRFVYGNDGWDCINDYTTNLESVLAPVNAYADSLSA